MFFDLQVVVCYVEVLLCQVFGFFVLQQMSCLLLVECVFVQGCVLVFGVGGGFELKVFVEVQLGWQLFGVDLVVLMLVLVEQILGLLKLCVQLLEGYIDDVFDLCFDGVSCLLILYFFDVVQCLYMFCELYRCLQFGVLLVVVYYSVLQDLVGKLCWLQCYVVFVEVLGVVYVDVQCVIDVIVEWLLLLVFEQEVVLMQEVGFDGVELFYVGFSFRGWVVYVG